ncbi:MAG: YdbL family protein [Kiritimatiellae bacterium]|nr:YdbL family protein [Kiritimatiellia bacterium]
MKRNLFWLTTVLLAVACLGNGVDLDAMKAQFRTRKPKLEKLKAEGLIGENNGGYLAYLTKKRPQEKLVNAENNDRRILYAHIAGKTDVPVETVGKRRALQIAKEAAPGHMLQDEKGNWYRKPPPD